MTSWPTDSPRPVRFAGTCFWTQMDVTSSKFPTTLAALSIDIWRLVCRLLPGEAILNIFRTRCHLVMQRIFSVGVVDMIDFSHINEVNSADFGYFARSLRALKTLQWNFVDEQHRTSTVDQLAMFCTCSTLQELYITCYVASDLPATCPTIAELFPNLKKLSWINFHICVAASASTRLLSRLPNTIEELYMDIDANDLPDLLTLPESLRKLFLFRAARAEPRRGPPIELTSLCRSISLACPHLLELELDPGNVANRSLVSNLEIVLRAFPKLQSLRFWDRMDRSATATLSSGSLQKLEICIKGSGSTPLKLLCASMPNLSSLAISTEVQSTPGHPNPISLEALPMSLTSASLFVPFQPSQLPSGIRELTLTSENVDFSHLPPGLQSLKVTDAAAVSWGPPSQRRARVATPNKPPHSFGPPPLVAGAGVGAFGGAMNGAFGGAVNAGFGGFGGAVNAGFGGFGGAMNAGFGAAMAPQQTIPNNKDPLLDIRLPASLTKLEVSKPFLSAAQVPFLPSSLRDLQVGIYGEWRDLDLIELRRRLPHLELLKFFEGTVSISPSLPEGTTEFNVLDYARRFMLSLISDEAHNSKLAMDVPFHIETVAPILLPPSITSVCFNPCEGRPVKDEDFAQLVFMDMEVIVANVPNLARLPHLISLTIDTLVDPFIKQISIVSDIAPLVNLRRLILKGTGLISPFKFHELPRCLEVLYIQDLPASSLTHFSVTPTAVDAMVTPSPRARGARAVRGTNPHLRRDNGVNDVKMDAEASHAASESGGYEIGDLPETLTDLHLGGLACSFGPGTIEKWPQSLVRLSIRNSEWLDTQALALKKHLFRAKEILLHGSIIFSGNLQPISSSSSFASPSSSSSSSETQIEDFPRTFDEPNIVAYLQRTLKPVQFQLVTLPLNGPTVILDQVHTVCLTTPKEPNFDTPRVAWLPTLSGEAPLPSSWPSGLTSLTIKSAHITMELLEKSNFALQSLTSLSLAVRSLPQRTESFAFLPRGLLHYHCAPEQELIHPIAYESGAPKHLPRGLRTLHVPQALILSCDIDYLPKTLRDVAMFGGDTWTDKTIVNLFHHLSSTNDLQSDILDESSMDIDDSNNDDGERESDTSIPTIRLERASATGALIPPSDLQKMNWRTLFRLTEQALGTSIVVAIWQGEHRISLPQSVVDLDFFTGPPLPLMSNLHFSLVSMPPTLVSLQLKVRFPIVVLQLQDLPPTLTLLSLSSTMGVSTECAQCWSALPRILKILRLWHNNLEATTFHTQTPFRNSAVGLPTTLEELYIPHISFLQAAHYDFPKTLRRLCVHGLGSYGVEEAKAMLTNVVDLSFFSQPQFRRY